MGNPGGAAARSYHEATKHSLASVRGDPYGLDWGNMPLPFKVYTALEPIPLPRDFEPSRASALDAIAGRGPDGRDEAPLDLHQLAQLLYFSAGVLRRRDTPIGETYFRAAACTGNLHHVELYLIAGALPDLAPGVYHFGAHDFALRRLRDGDHRAHLVDATAGEPRVAAAPATLAFTSTFWRNSWKYRARAYRHSFWDSGTLLANLLAVAAARALPAHVALGFVDATVNRLLDVDPDREVTLGLVALGRGATAPPPAQPIGGLGYEVLPLSATEIDYPAIRAAHAAGALESPDEVARWREEAGTLASAGVDARAGASSHASTSEAGPAESRPATPLPELVALPSAGEAPPHEPIERVILRRGSTRFFAHDPIDLAALATIFRTVTGAIPADFLPGDPAPSSIYVIANAVDGLAPGAYAHDRERDALLLLRHGTFRREAGYLGLGQEIPADAAANLYWLTDLRPVLDRLGNRGYRAAQLEAAIRGGKTYLAAYALRLGASGLTFFDDDVTEFFSPHAAGKSVMFLMAVGVRRRLRPASTGG